MSREPQTQPFQTNIGWGREPWWLLSVPLLALVFRISPAQIWENLQTPQVYEAIRISLTTTAITTIVSILFGTPVAYLLARRQVPFRPFIDTLIDLPIVLPPAVAGVALLIAFGRRGLVGTYLTDFGIDIAFSQVAVIMAQTFVAVPFYVKAAALGFGAVDRELEQAAAIDGANTWQVFRRVTLPLAWTALISGGVMTWARALGEFGATILFAGNFPGRTQTMPLAIYIGFELDLDIALTLAVIMVGLSFLVLLIVKGLLNRELYTVGGK